MVTEELSVEQSIPTTKLTNSNILFLDISSNCTGFAIMSINFLERKAELIKAGAVWLDANWEHAQKYSYMAGAIQNYFNIVDQVDFIIVEQYSVNPKKMMGINVVSEMQGAIKSAAWDVGLKVQSILPQTWRAALGIKANVTAGKDGKNKRDYKAPTKTKVLESVAVPEESISNLTKKPRMTPSDTYDAIAIALGWAKKNNIRVSAKSCKFDDHVGYLAK